MREYWANVYAVDGAAEIVYCAPTRRESVEGLMPCGLACCRIHVRLKPEGAPKRYANARDRWLWEHDPAWCRRLKDGFDFDVWA